MEVKRPSIEHSKVVLRPLFPLKFQKGGKSHGVKEEKYKQTKKINITQNGKKLAVDNWILSRIRFLGVDVADIFSSLEIYSAGFTLFGIYNQNQGTDEITELNSIRKGIMNTRERG